MSPRFQVRPTVRRLSFAFAILTTASVAAPAASSPPELSQIGKPGAVEAARILDQFRRSGIAGEYYLEFELRALPRRGEERVFNGRLWGGRNVQGAINRIELVDGDGRKHRLLVQNGAHATVWRLAEARVSPLGIAALFAPVIPGVEVTAFDLQMPFLYWPDAVLQSINRILGRPAHAFLFRPPAGFAAENPEVAAARAFLDTQFNALLQTELIGRDGRILKTFSLVSLKTVDKQPVPKSVDFLNAITRDKTRLQVRGIALHLDLAPSLFEPAALAEEIGPPAAAKILRLDP
jgi:hypothetical protein